ncbi:MAG TPA: matrixin family metalloprotease [Candidatus Eisenbacteria bacterium]
MKPTRFSIVAAFVCGALALAIAHPAAAFVRIARQASPTSPVVQAHWLDTDLPLPIAIDGTNSDIPTAMAVSIVQTSAQTWQDINTSYFTADAHAWGGTELPPALAFDGQNSVFFDVAGVNFPPGGTVIAFTRSVIELTAGQTLDADLVYNDRDFYSSTTSPALTPAPAGQTSVDLQAVITHELGHAFGLDHTSVAGCTMVPFISNDTTQRTLELDDRAGNSTIYPESAARGLSPGAIDFAATTGTVSGTVVSGYNGSAIFCAHVEAYSLLAPTPDHTISAISGELTLRNGHGEFTIHGLPPGPYAIAIVPLDGVHTVAADDNIGGPYNGIDTNFEPEFWNGAGESGNGFNDNPNLYTQVDVNAGANSGGVDFITNTYPGRVIIAQYGAFENIVTFTNNNNYLAVRFDPPFDPPYTISDIQFPSFTFNGVPATFVSAGLYPMKSNGLPDLANPIVKATPFVGSPNGINIATLNLPVTQAGQTFFWALQFPPQPGSFPNNFPFVRMDFTSLEKGLYANSYSATAAGGGGVLIDRNIAVSMTCQLASPDMAPIVEATQFGANRRATNTEFSYTPPGDTRADGFALPNNSLDHVDLIERAPISWSTMASGGAGASKITVSPSPAATPATIWAAQAVDKSGHRSLQSSVSILGLSEDADEPNGRSNEATVLTTPVVNRAETYSPAGDQDWYSLTAKVGDVIEASANATGLDGRNDLDLVMFLLDTNGDLVAFNDDFTGLNPKITYTVPPPSGNSASKAARKFSILVTDFRGSALNPTGTPRVVVPQTYVLNAKVTTPALAARIGGRTINPDEFFFANSGPNPANPVAKFVFSVPRSADGQNVRINVFDVKGRLVRTLIDANAAAGPHTILWDGHDRDGRSVASGTYFARMEAGSWRQDARVTILK